MMGNPMLNVSDHKISNHITYQHNDGSITPGVIKSQAKSLADVKTVAKFQENTSLRHHNSLPAMSFLTLCQHILWTLDKLGPPWCSDCRQIKSGKKLAGARSAIFLLFMVEMKNLKNFLVLLLLLPV